MGPRFRLANCYEHSGRIASAWAQFLEVASIAKAGGETDREQAAIEDRAQRLEPRLPRLVIKVPAAHQVEGLTVLRDQTPVGSVQWNRRSPVDPGPHEIVVEAPGYLRATHRVDAQEAATVGFTVPALSRSGDSAPAVPLAPVHNPRRLPLWTRRRARVDQALGFGVWAGWVSWALASARPSRYWRFPTTAKDSRRPTVARTIPTCAAATGLSSETALATKGTSLPSRLPSVVQLWGQAWHVARGQLDPRGSFEQPHSTPAPPKLRQPK